MLVKLFCSVLFVGILISPQFIFAQNAQSGAYSPEVVYTIESGKTITLHCNSEYASAYQWYKNAVKLPGATGKDLITADEGVFNVIAFNEEGCTSVQSDNVKIIIAEAVNENKVDLSLQLQPLNNQIISGQWSNYRLSAFNNSLTDATGISVTIKLIGNLLYQPDLNNQLIQYDEKSQLITWYLNTLKGGKQEAGSFKIKALQPGQMEVLAVIKGLQPDPDFSNNTKRLNQEARLLDIPNVFTPNGDGVNDTFVIPGLDSFTESEISIINKAGASVFLKKNYGNDWSGEGLPEGTYFYLLKLKDEGGNWQIYKSYITLLRSKL